MKPVIIKSFLAALIIALIAAPMAGAELSPMDNADLRKVNARAGIRNVGIDSLTAQDAFLKTGFGEKKEVIFNKTFDGINLGFLEQAPTLTMTDVQFSGSIHRGGSFTEILPEEAPGQFHIHHHFDNYEITLDHFSTDALYPAGRTNGPSFGALEISGGRMRISGDVYVGIRE